MSDINSNISRTLNGSTAFTVGGDTYQWFDRSLDYLRIWAPDDLPQRAITLNFGSHSWQAGIIRVGGNANVTINDNSTGTTDDTRVFIANLMLNASGTTTANLKNTDVEVIYGGGGVQNVTIGYWATHIGLNRGDDTVKVVGTGEVGTMELGRGNDTLTTTGDAWVGSAYFSQGNDVVSLGAGGAHFIHLGKDADTIKFSANTQSTIAHGGEDVSGDVPGAKDSDTVDFSALTNALVIDLNGRSTVEGTNGDYLISNFENATGGKGKDTIIANDEVNILKGGTGADTFVFESKAAAHGDKILDFSQTETDKIGLSAIDANSAVSGNQAFTFIGTAAFGDKAGQLRYELKSGDTIIHGDINGDGVRDFSIILDASVNLKVGDFIL